jgi:TP901 family phage tail tape measure protein
MPLGIRDILLIIRAQDLASREIGRVGSALGSLGAQGGITGQQLMGVGAGMVAVGTGVAALGAAGVAFMKSSADAAMAYSNSAALTLTQVDAKYGASLKQIKDIGKNVAGEIPAPFEEMQKTLFDIFSSMDVNTSQAEKLLASFSKAAVAGQTDVQAAARASISIMNAFKIPVEDVTKVMDVQFQAVRKGVFTYEEFAKTIGRAIPSTVRAGGSIQDLAGMMAFMTRNGMSAAQAATSAARSFDLLSNPKFGKNMKDFGIDVADAAGNFRPMVDVAQDLRAKMAGLSEEARSTKLKELTMGAGGVIQAMRFMNLAILDTKGLLPELTTAMNDSGGAMTAAYDIMAQQPQAKLQQLKNKWQILRTEIGDVVLPIFMRLVDVGITLIAWFNNLDPHLRDNLIKFALFGSVVAVITGLVLVFVGVITMMVGGLMIMGLSLGAAIGVLLAIPIVIALIIAAIVLLIQNWDSVKAAAQSLADTLSVIWDGIKTSAISFWQSISDNVGRLVGVAADIVKKIWTDIKIWWVENGKQMLDNAKGAFQAVVDAVQTIWGPLVEAVGHIFNAIMFVIRIVLDVISLLWNQFGDRILNIITILWNTIFEVIRGVINAIAGIIKFILAVINGDWGAAWDAIKQIADGIWDAIFGIVRGALLLIKEVVGTILEVLGGLIEKVVGFGVSIVEGLIKGIKSMASKLGDVIKDLIKDHITGPIQSIFHFGSPSKLTTDMGKMIGVGLANGLSDSEKLVREASDYLARAAQPSVTASVGASSGSGSTDFGTFPPPASGGNTLVLEAGAITIVDARDPEATAKAVDERLRRVIDEWRSRG